MSSDAPAGEVAASLAGYLCGTKLWLDPRLGRVSSESIASRHRRVTPATLGEPKLLGGSRWIPDWGAAELRDELLESLRVPGILDLVFFGSQARGGGTGYSDVDAILILEDDLVDDQARLRALRPPVLAAQRAVLAYQPMQHHGFLVTTPRLLTHASSTLGMPGEAFLETVSLVGKQTRASFAVPYDARPPFLRLAADLLAIRMWPNHPWHLHRCLSMFELLPALYLQATARAVPKHASFAIAAEEFGNSWWPYENLEAARAFWPRTQRRTLATLAHRFHNPWLVVSVWRRLPVDPPDAPAQYLTGECLAGLRVLTARMLDRVR